MKHSVDCVCPQAMSEQGMMCKGVHGTTRVHIRFCPSTGMHTLPRPGHAHGCIQNIVYVKLGLTRYALARDDLYSAEAYHICSVQNLRDVYQLECKFLFQASHPGKLTRCPLGDSMHCPCVTIIGTHMLHDMFTYAAGCMWFQSQWMWTSSIRQG